MAAGKGLYPRSAGRKRDGAPLTAAGSAARPRWRLGKASIPAAPAGSATPLTAAAATPGNMVYVADGQVVDSRSQAPWRLSSIVQFFWGIVEFIAFFFRTLFNPSGTKFKGTGNQSSWGRPDDGRGPPGVPRKRMGRINHGGGPAPPPMSGG